MNTLSERGQKVNRHLPDEKADESSLGGESPPVTVQGAVDPTHGRKHEASAGLDSGDCPALGSDYR